MNDDAPSQNIKKENGINFNDHISIYSTRNGYGVALITYREAGLIWKYEVNHTFSDILTCFFEEKDRKTIEYSKRYLTQEIILLAEYHQTNRDTPIFSDHLEIQNKPKTPTTVQMLQQTRQ